MKTLLLSLLVLLAAPAALAQQPQREAPPAPGTPKDFSLPERREFTLDNGLKVTLVPYGTVPRVDVQLAVRSGNAFEKKGQTWMADVVAQMLTEGTTRRNATQLAEAAARMGGSVDATATPDLVNVGGTVLAESAPDMVRLVAEVVREPAFPAADFERVRADLARQAALQKSQPQAQSAARFYKALYGDHPYGQYFPEEKAVLGYTLEQAKAFYQDTFGAGRAHLYVVGRYDAAATEAAVREAFGGWDKGPAVQDTKAKPATRRAVHVLDRPGAVQSSMYVGLPVTTPPGHPDYLGMTVTNALLGGSFASRITSNIREQKGYTYSPNSQLATHVGDAFWAEVADVTTNVTGPSLKEILHEVDRLGKEAPSAEELKAIQQYLVGTFVTTSSSRDGLLARLRFKDLHGLPDSYLTDYVKNVLALTPQDVQRLAKQHLRSDRMTVVIVGDRKQVEPQLRPFGKVTVEGAK